MPREFTQTRVVGYLASVLGVFFVALAFWPFYKDVRGITAASALLTIVLLVAVNWGMGPALVFSILGAVYLNIFWRRNARSAKALSVSQGRPLTYAEVVQIERSTVGEECFIA
jgi:hypothetical protein